MSRTMPLASCLSLAALSLGVALHAQTPAQPQPIIPAVKNAATAGDLAKADALITAFRKEKGDTPEALEAFSWLGRGALGAKELDRAEQYALQAYDLSLKALEKRGLDDEAHLPIALGAAIEVRAQVLAARGNRSEAVYYLREEATTYGKTSIIQRINKNLNLLSLEGQPAFEITSTEWLGGTPFTLAGLKGKPVILFLWAHWCPDCKAMSPTLDALMNEYGSTGLTLVAPTQRYGYVAQRKTAPPDEELAYIKSIRRQFYAWMPESSVPVSEDIFLRYGVSTTPTVVFINRDGKVRLYHPGQMKREEMEPIIRDIVQGSSR
jgi:cytochrome c biogenesis protein CcmG/thiol:disulfide interchange protein DsbE